MAEKKMVRSGELTTFEKEYEKDRKEPIKILKARDYPLNKIAPIILFSLQKQYPGKKFKAVRIEDVKQGRLRSQRMYGIEK